MTGAAIVTGAAGGVGSAIVSALAADGWQVAACDRTPDAAYRFDVTDAAAAREAVASIERDLGPVQAVVANAAVVDRVGDARRTSPEAWADEIDINLNGVYNTIQPALEGMAERGGGRIVVTSSAAGLSGLRGQSAYAASKAGLFGLVKSLALELAPAGITVNALALGMVATEKVEGMPEPVKQRMRDGVPLRRFGEPAEVAALVAFLLSDAAGYITGTTITMDGGLTLAHLHLGSDR